MATPTWLSGEQPPVMVKLNSAWLHRGTARGLSTKPAGISPAIVRGRPGASSVDPSVWANLKLTERSGCAPACVSTGAASMALAQPAALLPEVSEKLHWKAEQDAGLSWSSGLWSFAKVSGAKDKPALSASAAGKKASVTAIAANKKRPLAGRMLRILRDL